MSYELCSSSLTGMNNIENLKEALFHKKNLKKQAKEMCNILKTIFNWELLDILSEVKIILPASEFLQLFV